MKSLDVVVAETIRKHKDGQGIEELADLLGVKPAMVYRLSNPFDEDARINSKHIIPLMQHTKNYSLLKHIAQRCGFLCVKLPRVRSSKETEIGLYQRRQAEAIRAVVAFFQRQMSVDEALEAVRKEMESAAGFMKAIEEAPSLFEEEEEDK